MAPEGNLDNPADEEEERNRKSADGIELRKEEEGNVDRGMNAAEERKKSGVEDEPAVNSSAHCKELKSNSCIAEGTATSKSNGL